MKFAFGEPSLQRHANPLRVSMRSYRGGGCRGGLNAGVVTGEKSLRRAEEVIRRAGGATLRPVGNGGLERLPGRDLELGAARSHGRGRPTERHSRAAGDLRAALDKRVVQVERGLELDAGRRGVVVLDRDRLHDARATLYRRALDRAGDREVANDKQVRTGARGGEGRGDGGGQGQEGGGELHD